MTRRWFALGVLTLAVLLIGVDGTVLALATPFIGQDLGATFTQILWIGDIYSFVLAGLLISMGKDDHCLGHTFTPAIAKALAAKTAAYIHFDEETMPFAGHSAAMKKDFAVMFGECIHRFFTQEPAPRLGAAHITVSTTISPR